MLDLFSTFWGASPPNIGAIGGKVRVPSGSGKGDRNQTGGESSGSWTKKASLTVEPHASKQQPPKAPSPSPGPAGESVARPLPICVTRRLKTIPTPPLFVPVAAEPAPSTATTQVTVSNPAKPSFTPEQALERIQTLLRPPTPIAREVVLTSIRLSRGLRSNSLPMTTEASEANMAQDLSEGAHGDFIEEHVASGVCPVPELAVELSAAASRLGCRVVVRRVTDSKQYWSKAMGRTFAICTLPAGPGGVTVGSQVGGGLVIDPNFKAQFITPNMTQRYRDIWTSLPEVFVGQASQLSPLVQLLCYELTLMFEEIGRPLPPWRAFPATIGRWLSNACIDIAVPTVAAATVVAAGGIPLCGMSLEAARAQVDRFYASFHSGIVNTQGGPAILNHSVSVASGVAVTAGPAAAHGGSRVVQSRCVQQRSTGPLIITGFDLKHEQQPALPLS